jgi:hypothetical protein
VRIGDPRALQNPAYRLADVDLGRSAETPPGARQVFGPGHIIRNIHPASDHLQQIHFVRRQLKLIGAIFAQFAAIKPAKNMFKNMLRTPTRAAYLSPAWTL